MIFTKDSKDIEDWSSRKVLFYCHKLFHAAVVQNDKAGKQRSADKTTISTLFGLKKKQAAMKEYFYPAAKHLIPLDPF